MTWHILHHWFSSNTSCPWNGWILSISKRNRKDSNPPFRTLYCFLVLMWWSEECLTRDRNLKPISNPMSRCPTLSKDLHFRSHLCETHCISPNNHSFFFWFYQSQPRNPQTVLVPKTHRPPSSFYLPIWLPLMLSSG